jgi:hypothetical protein
VPATLLEYRIRIRNAADSADALTISSVAGGTNPYLIDPPRGDGCELLLPDGGSRTGTYKLRVADAITSGTSRVLTALLSDANGLPDLLSRKTYVDVREDGGSWDVLIAGYLNRVELESGIAAVLEIGESNRLELTTSAFGRKTTVVSGAPVREPMSTYLARWPQRGCLLGGPIIGDWGPMPDAGGWEGRVTAVSGSEIVIGIIAGHLPPAWTRTTNTTALRTFVNPKAAPYFARVPTQWEKQELDEPLLLTPIFTGLHALVTPVGGTRQIGIPRPLVTPILGDVFNTSGDLLSLENGNVNLRVILLPGSTVPTVGALVRVRVITSDVSELSPIYVTDHPATIYSTLRTEAGAALDSASVTAAIAAVGGDRRISLRVTEAKALAALAKDTLLGPHGLATRPGSAGQDELVYTRIRETTAPATTVTDDDLADGQPVTWYEHDEEDVLTGLELRQQRYVPAPADATNPPADGVLVQQERIERPFGDQTTFGRRAQVFEVEGMLHTKDSFDTDAPTYADTFAFELRDRFARGAVWAELPLIRGTDGFLVREGEELLVNVAALPNRQKRLGDDPSVPARAMQVVRRTIAPWGALAKLLDSGPNAQFTGTAPTVTIAASAGALRTGADITITNAATLNAESSGVRIQAAITTGGAPTSADYADVVAYAAGTIPTTAIPLPRVKAGRTVYARARSERTTERPSGWSAAASVTLSALDAPTALTATAATDGSRCRLAWTPGANAGDAVVEVTRRLSTESAGDARRIVALLPGSIRCEAEGLTPGTAYVFGVQHRDPTTGDLSALTTVSVTTSGTTVTLDPPDAVQGFAGSVDAATGVPVRSARIGIAARVSTGPAFLEVEEQHELAPAGAASRDLDAYAAMSAAALRTLTAASTFSSWATFGRAPVIPGQWTMVAADAPNDGCVRFLRARVTREGATASSWADEVAVVPWSVRGLPDKAGRIATFTGAPNTGTDDIDLAWSTFGLPAGHTLTLYIDDESSPGAFPVTSSEEDVTGLTSFNYPTGTNVVGAGTATQTRFTLEAQLSGAVLVSRSVLVLWFR